MESFFSFLKVCAICGAALVALFLILLALPQSRLRSGVLELVGWVAGSVAALLVISPVDLIPDVIPVAGQVDDLAYIVCALASFWMAYKQRTKRIEDGEKPPRIEEWHDR